MSESPQSRIVAPAIESTRANRFAGRYAICDANGRVLNTIMWDGVSPWLPPRDCVARHDPHGEAAPGGRWLGGSVDGDRYEAPLTTPGPDPAIALGRAIDIEQRADAAGRLAARLPLGAARDAALAEETRLRAEAEATITDAARPR